MHRHPCRAGRWRPTFPGRVRRRRAPSFGRAAPARRCARCRRSTSGPAVPRSTDPERRSRYRLNGPCKFNVSRSGHYNLSTRKPHLWTIENPLDVIYLNFPPINLWVIKWTSFNYVVALHCNIATSVEWCNTITIKVTRSHKVPLAQWIARWTSNPKVLGSTPRWDAWKNVFF